jgi:hypothetical protein
MIEEIHALNREMIAAGVRKFACGISPAANAKTVRKQSASGAGDRLDPVLEERKSRDERRPYAETKEQLGGILVLEARDMNHAVQLMVQHPAMTYGNIFEIQPAGDMNEIMKASEQRRRPNTAR